MVPVDWTRRSAWMILQLELASEYSNLEPFGRILTKLDMREHTKTVKNPIVYGCGRLNTALRMTDFAAKTR